MLRPQRPLKKGSRRPLKNKNFACFALVFIFAAFALSGCSTFAKWDKQIYTANKKLAEQSMDTWSFNSGFYTCAMQGATVEFPVTVKNYKDLNLLFNNPSVISGMAQLDALAREMKKWNDDDYRLGCFQGTQVRMTVSEVVQVIKTLYPQSAAYLPSLTATGK